MHAEALPGPVDSSARTSMMSQLIDKPVRRSRPPVPALDPRRRVALPRWARWARAAQSAGASKPGLAAAAALAAQPTTRSAMHELFDEGDEW